MTQLKQEEDFEEWFLKNSTSLEASFIEEIPPEDHPLDDDFPDFMDSHSEEYSTFVTKQYLGKNENDNR